MIHEYFDGSGKFDARTDNSVPHNGAINVTEAATEPNIDPNSLMVDIEALHAAPHATRNFTRYTPKCLKNSLSSWTHPYNAPLIKHHNEKDGEIIGRIVAAEYKTRDTFSNTPALLLTANIPGEEAKQSVKNGILQTVSIGVMCDDIRCSICGKEVELDEQGNQISCEHHRGETYDGNTCYWDINSMEAKELSYVIVPSDMYAKNVRSYPATKNSGAPILHESAEDMTRTRKGDNSMNLEEMQAELTKVQDEVSTLKSSLKTVTEAKDALDKQVTELQEAAAATAKQIETLESEKAETVKKLEALEAEKAELTTKVSDLQEAAKAQEEKAAEELKMKEGLEAELTTAKVSLKESMVDNLQALRKLAGKTELDREKVMAREESSIKDSIEDLKAELTPSVTESLPAPGSVQNPGLTEEADENKKTSVKEQSTASNVDLEAGLTSLFMRVARGR